MVSVILSVIGSDRPGLTQALADAVLAAGGNWLEGHLSQLGGLYVGSVLVELDAGQIDALRAGVAAVDAQGLEVRLTPALTQTTASGIALDFKLIGQDRLGIVRQVTAVLAGLNVNIEAFETRIVAEAHSGAPLFEAAAHLRLPPGLPAGDVQAALEAISAEIMVDIALTPG